MQSGLNFEEEVAQRLRGAGIRFEREPTVNGLQPDFIVPTGEESFLVIETKIKSNLPRDSKLLELWKTTTGAEQALMVVRDLSVSRPSEGIYTPGDIVSAIFRFVIKPPARTALPKRVFAEKRDIIFSAMPFDPQYDDVYFVAMAPAAESVNAVCKRVDKEEFVGDIVIRIRKLIKDSVAVIVDLSESKPNVLYEAGYAHALKKQTSHICSTPLEGLPFDVRNWNTIKYRKGQTYHLRDKLSERLKTILP